MSVKVKFESDREISFSNLLDYYIKYERQLTLHNQHDEDAQRKKDAAFVIMRDFFFDGVNSDTEAFIYKAWDLVDNPEERIDFTGVPIY